MDNKFDKFVEELKELQDKYNIYLQAEYQEDWDEDYFGDMHCYGTHAYLVAYNEDVDEVYVVPEDCYDSSSS